MGSTRGWRVAGVGVGGGSGVGKRGVRVSSGCRRPGLPGPTPGWLPPPPPPRLLRDGDLRRGRLRAPAAGGGAAAAVAVRCRAPAASRRVISSSDYELLERRNRVLLIFVSPESTTVPDT